METWAANTGINLYDYNPGDNNLRGCVNDSLNLVARFPCDHILLRDEKATLVNIIAAWRVQRDKCKPGDTLRITHSSHGIPEGIVCHDTAVKNGEWVNYITYPMIADFCRDIPESILVEFLIDACHVQAGLKALGFTYGKAKIMRPAEGDSVKVIKPVKVGELKPNVILWAACEPNQTSCDADIDKQYQGAFTWAFLKFEQGRSRSDTIYYAREALKQYGQTPHLYCGKALAAGRVV